MDSSETRAETEVSGRISGGGGTTYGGTGFAAPVRGSIQSKTTRYQTIFLTDDDGVEHNIQLVNFLVPCKQGQKLTLLMVGPAADDHGHCFRAYNHNTRDHAAHAKAIISSMFPRKMFMLAMAVIGAFVLYNAFVQNESFGAALFMTAFIMLFAAAAVAGVGWVIAFVRSISVRANPALKSYIAGLGPS
ncbi:MAG: hypothetical protein WD078_05260 [Woeseia sp.]